MHLIGKWILGSLALLAPSALWADDEIVSKVYFKQLKTDQKEENQWVVMDADGEKLTVDADCSNQAALVLVSGTERIYYLYTAPKSDHFCVFGLGEWEKAKLAAGDGVKLNNQEISKMYKPAGNSGAKPLPRPFVTSGDTFSFTLELGEQKQPVRVWRRVLEKDASLPKVALVYTDSKTGDEFTAPFEGDSLKLDTREVTLKRILVSTTLDPAIIREINVTSGGRSIVQQLYSVDDCLPAESQFDVSQTVSGDVQIFVRYDFVGADYHWNRNQTKTYTLCLDSGKEPRPVIPVKSRLIKLLGILMGILSAGLVFFFIRERIAEKRAETGEGSEIDVLGLLAGIERYKTDLTALEGKLTNACNEQERLFGEVGRMKVDMEAKDAAIGRLSQEKDIVTGQLEAARQECAKLVGEKTVLEQKLKAEQEKYAELERQIQQQLKELEANIRKEYEDRVRTLSDTCLYGVRDRLRVWRSLLKHMRTAERNMGAQVLLSTPWRKELDGFSLSFAALSDNLHTTLPADDDPGLKDLKVSELQDRLCQCILPFLGQRTSCVNTAIRFYAYYQNAVVAAEMSQNGLSYADVALFYHSMRGLFFDCGIELEAPPRLFMDQLDEERQVHDNMDSRISHLYPEYRQLVAQRAVVDILTTGYSIRNEQHVRPVVFSYSKPMV